MSTPAAQPPITHRPVLVEPAGAISSPKLDGSGLHIGLVYTREFVEEVNALVMSCRGELLLKGVGRANIHELEVTHVFSLPYAIKRLIQSAPVKLDAIVVIGCLIRGQSIAFEFVAEAVTRASMKIGMKYKTPVVYGVLICSDIRQARHCAGIDEGTNKTRHCGFGVEWAQSAIEMAHLNRKSTQKMVEACECECHSRRTNQQTDTEQEQEEQLSLAEQKKQEYEMYEEGDPNVASAFS